MKKLGMVLGLSVLIAGGAAAQVTQSATATITVPTVLYVNSDNVAVTFPSPAATDFNAGLIAASSGANVSHAGNVKHAVLIYTTAANMTGSGGGAAPDAVNPAKAVGDFEWKTSGSFNPILTEATPAAALAAGAGATLGTSARGSGTIAVSFQMLLSYSNDTPGTYTLPFYFATIAN